MSDIHSDFNRFHSAIDSLWVILTLFSSLFTECRDHASWCSKMATGKVSLSRCYNSKHARKCCETCQRLRLPIPSKFNDFTWLSLKEYLFTRKALEGLKCDRENQTTYSEQDTVNYNIVSANIILFKRKGRYWPD